MSVQPENNYNFDLPNHVWHDRTFQDNRIWIYPPDPGHVPMSPLCADFHEIEAITSYDDGAFGNCKNCGLRVKVPSIPCGINGLLVKDLLTEVITQSRDDSELLAALGELVALMDVEKDELALAEARLQTIHDILTERSGLVG